MLRVLLAKDLRRAARNPLPWLINLMLPLAMTALLGLVFGGKSDTGALGRIRFAVVDEDKSALSNFLRGAANQREGGKYLEPVFLEREEAMRQVNADKLSAVLIIPTNFTRNYLLARQPVSLELIKNPAESIHPAVLEELLGCVVTALNAISRNFGSELPDWEAVFQGREDYHKVSFLIERAGDKLKMAKHFINPPIVAYEKPDPESVSPDARASTDKAGAGGDGNAAGAKSAGSGSGKKTADGSRNIFGYLLLGLSAMFLLFLGGTAMTDLHRELAKRTFERYQTLRQQLWPFIAGKIVFAVVGLLLCAAVMLGGGGLVFRVHWQHPIPLVLITLGYACSVAALFAVLIALVPDERRAGVLNNMAGMALGLVGGCALPPEQLPAVLREHVTPLMPTYWFTETARALQFNAGPTPWLPALFKLLLAGIALAALAAMLFRNRFRSGLRS
jgi:ABC-type sugar transport system permease subunit